MKVDQILFVLVFNVGIFSTSAWDVAVAVGGQIQFLNATGGVIGTLSEGMSDVGALAYNADLLRMYFSDNELPNGSIFGLTVPKEIGANRTAEIHTVVSKQVHQVKGVAYDDMTGILYWSNGAGHAIMWVKVASTDHPQAGQPLLRVEDQTPMGLAIDNCKRYLYWTNCDQEHPSIERSLLDGSGRKTLISRDLILPYSVVVDQTTDRLYWVDERPGAEFRIESADLDGNERKILVNGLDHQPFALAISAGNVFWADHIHLSVWRLPLETPFSISDPHPLQVSSYGSSPKALVSAYSGVWSQEHCSPVIEPVMKVIPATVTKTSAETSITERLNMSHPVCFNKGIWLSEGDYCDCLPGFSGMLCEVNACLDYCVHGECHSSNQGPECACSEGYTGRRCEVPVCHNYCVTGTCSVDLTGQPQCHCREGYAGERCEVNFTQQQELKDHLQEVCKTFCTLWTQSSKETIQPFAVCSCGSETELPEESRWKSDYILIVLMALCSILMIVVAVLTKRVFVLQKRPRIKKRIIVNKSVTPLTCRPNPTGNEQCEITIENCCNMNICETPCFEPDFRQPGATLTKSNDKGAKEEKKTLLGNIELPPDDLY